MKKKSLIMLVCALMVVSSVAFGTIAYLTDRQGVTNNFTIGNVTIKVDETKVDENGVPEIDETVKPTPENPEPLLRTEESNTYPLTPASVYTKDPTMTVLKGSKESYVRMVVTLTNAAELLEIFEDLKLTYSDTYGDGFVPEDHVEGWSNDTWKYIVGKQNLDANTITLEFRYVENGKDKPINATEADVVLPPLFTHIRIPGELTNDHLEKLEGFSIQVDGHAIQTTGFSTADEAWVAFDKQTSAIENATTTVLLP